MPVTSTPSSTSQAAVRNVDGAVLSWWKWPVSNEMPAYRAAAACGEKPQPERAGDVADELAGAARLAAHERQLAVARVVVMVVDVDGDVAPARERQAVRVARVERVERGVRRRRAAAHAPGGQQDVAERQELVLRDVELGRRRRAARRGRACRPPRRARRQSGFSWTASATRRSPRMRRHSASRSAASGFTPRPRRRPPRPRSRRRRPPRPRRPPAPRRARGSRAAPRPAPRPRA